MSVLRKFSPDEIEEAVFRAIATAREGVVARILATIDRNAAGGPVQHLQVVAPRGYGKSFLLRLVRLAIADRAAPGQEQGQGPALRIAALREEASNIDAPHRLLEEIARLLEGRPAEAAMGAAFRDPEGAWEAAEAGLDAATAAALPAGGGLVVAMVENLDTLITRIFKGRRDQSRLRAWLARPGARVMLLATSTRQADAEYEQRLFHATGVIHLDPWQEQACIDFFGKLRGTRGPDAAPMPEATLAKARAIALFIGGSPRMATVLAEVLESNDSLAAAAVLDALIDELKPYYKARIDSLPREALSVLDALLRGGEPATQSELARRLGTEQKRIARPFQDLRARGEVVGEKAVGSAEVLYRVGDRLMAHYYRRHHLDLGAGGSVLEAIAEFLAGFFTTEEKRAEAERLHGMGRAADAAVLERLAAMEAAPGAGAGRTPWLRAVDEETNALVAQGRAPEAVTLMRDAAARAEREASPRDLAWAVTGLGWCLGRMGDHAAAVETLRRAIALAGEAGDRGGEAEATRHLGWSLGAMGDHAAAVETLQRAIALAGEAGDRSEEARATRLLGWRLGQMGDLAAAVETLRRAIALAGEAGDRGEEAVATRHLGSTLGRMGEHAAAVETLRRAIALAGEDGDRREEARATRRLGWTLGRMGEHAAAVETLRRAIALAGEAGDRGEDAWAAVLLCYSARAIAADAEAVTAWTRAVAAATAPEARLPLPDLALWLDDATIAGLRSGRFAEVWDAARRLPASAAPAAAPVAEALAALAARDGRAAAFAALAEFVSVLAASISAAAGGPDPLRFLTAVLEGVARRVPDPALLRDLAALLAGHLPDRTVALRALLDAAALRRARPEDAAALQRVDPDIATAIDRVLGRPEAPAARPRAGRAAAKRPRKTS